MAVATQNAPHGTRETQQDDNEFAKLMSRNARLPGLYKSLSGAAEKIEGVLPDFMKGQAERLIARALMTFATRPELEGCPDETFRRIVVEAAELGFAVDGKLCYVVKYKQAYQLQLDYKAVVAVAKRNRTIKDIDADVVRKNDHFKHGRFTSGDVLEHTFDCESPRGEVIAAYARVLLPDGTRNHCVMTREQLDGIQRRAPAKNGPWATDPDEMRKKTVIRRILKLYQDDPGLMRMLEVTGWQDEEDDQPATRPQTIDDLRQMFAASFQKPQAASEPLPDDDHTESTGDPDAVDQDALDKATLAFLSCTTETGLQYELDNLPAGLSEATMTAIAGAAHDRRVAMKEAGPAKGKTKQQQQEFVK